LYRNIDIPQIRAGPPWLYRLVIPFVAILAAGCAAVTTGEHERRDQLAPLSPTRARGLAYYTVGSAIRSHPISAGISLPPGATIHTGHDSFLDIRVKDGVRVRILPDTKVKVDLMGSVGSKIQPTLSLEDGGLLCLATDPTCETGVHLYARTLMVVLMAPGEFELRAQGDTAVFKGRAAVWELFDVIRNVHLFVEEGQLGKPDENRVRPLPVDAYASVRKAFDELKRE
jgi:hypothetical protein